MEDKLDLISIFELLNFHKKTKKGGLSLFISFTGIIFGCLELEDIQGFKEDWDKEISHGGKMGRSTAKSIYYRKRNLTERYPIRVSNSSIKNSDIMYDVENLILQYIQEKPFHEALREKIENEKSISEDDKNKLLKEKELNLFLSAVLIYEVINGWEVKKDSTKKNEETETQYDSFSYSVEVKENLPNLVEDEPLASTPEKTLVPTAQFIILPEEPKNDEITYSKFSNPTFTLESPASYVVFNSITNNPNIGDERNFVAIRENDSISKWRDHIVVEKNKEYKIRMYVHNNASNSELVATNVKAIFSVPNEYANSITVSGTLESDNASPSCIWDSATFVSNEVFSLEYIMGSALYENNAFGRNGTVIPDTIVTNKGALLGYDKLNGEIPGCFQYAGYLTISVKPHFAPRANYVISQKVRLVNSENQSWQDSVFASANDEIEYKIYFNNTGEAKLDNVMILVRLPEVLTYVNGSTILYNKSNSNGLHTSNNIWTTGIDIGGYTSNSNAYLYYRTRVSKEVKTNSLIKLFAKVDAGHGTKSSSVDVILS